MVGAVQGGSWTNKFGGQRRREGAAAGGGVGQKPIDQGAKGKGKKKLVQVDRVSFAAIHTHTNTHRHDARMYVGRYVCMYGCVCAQRNVHTYNIYMYMYTGMYVFV